MSETVWERRDCVSADVDGSLVLLDLDSLLYHSLNSTAAAVWQMLETPKTAPALVEGLCAQYRVSPEACSVSVERLLENLATIRLIQPTAGDTLQPMGGATLQPAG